MSYPSWETSPADLVQALMAIIHSLYPFTLGAALLVSNNHGEMYLSSEGTFDPEQDQTPESFFAGAMPKKATPELKEVKPPSTGVSSPQTERKEVAGQ